MIGRILAIAIAAAAAGPDDAVDEEPEWVDEAPPRLRVAGWGGSLFDLQRGGTVPFGGGEVSWAFDRLDLGVLAQAYRFGRERARSEWGPVVLARLEQRFETARGLEAAVALGIGAAREDDWKAWYQFTLGFRVVLGRAFAGGELGFEQDRWFRLGATLGLAVF